MAVTAADISEFGFVLHMFVLFKTKAARLVAGRHRHAHIKKKKHGRGVDKPATCACALIILSKLLGLALVVLCVARLKLTRALGVVLLLMYVTYLILIVSGAAVDVLQNTLGSLWVTPSYEVVI